MSAAMRSNPLLWLIPTLALTASCADVMGADFDVARVDPVGTTGGTQGGASTGSSPSRDASDAGGTAGGDAGAIEHDAAVGCVDPSAELCMQPRWLTRVVPYARGPGVSEASWNSILDAISQWQSAPVGDGELQFAEASIPDVPSLVFTGDTGCGVIKNELESVELAVSSCALTHDIAREIGVALGLPRSHQRSDRDQYLEVASSEYFDCSKGQFFDPCQTVGAVLAQLGPFRYSVMEAVYTASEEASTCALKPDGDYLHLPWGALDRQVMCDGTTTPEVNGDDHSALAELYAISEGWLPFAPAAVTGPVRSSDVVFYIQTPVLAAGSTGLAVFAWRWASDGSSRDLWKMDYDGASWGPWVKALPLPQGGSTLTLAAASRADSIEFLTAGPGGVFHVSYDGQWKDTWASLGAPGNESIHSIGVSSGEQQSFEAYILTHDQYYAPLAIYVAEYDGSTWGDWEQHPHQLPYLGDRVATYSGTYASSSSRVSGPAAFAREASRHVAVSSERGELFYTERSSQGWSSWISLGDIDNDSDKHWTEVAISGSDSRLDIFAIGILGRLWQISCQQLDCRDSQSWTRPRLIAGNGQEGLGQLAAVASSGHIDLVGVLSPLGLPQKVTDLWHKRWNAP